MAVAPIKEMTPQYITHWNAEKGKVRCMLTFHQPYHISRIRLALTLFGISIVNSINNIVLILG